MADQLLSQADVDALVSSLSRNEPVVSEPAFAKPVSADSGSYGVNATMSKAPALPSKSVPLPARSTPSPVKQTNVAVKPAPPVISSTRSTLPKNIIGAKSISPVRQEQKSEVSMEALNSLNAKVSSLTDQIMKMGNSLKRLENIEKRVMELEKKLENNKQSQELLHRVNQLSEEYKKVSNNLKGTPGYGVRHSFTCEKCEDQGHVAQMFRCTSCGHERWYGWWPNK
jgi:hypothetical protein